MRFNGRRITLIGAFAVWVIAVAAGLALLWRYENTSGANASPPAQWPAASSVNPATDRATLVMLVHPRCPCSRATIGELARLMAQTQDHLKAYALFVKPEGTSEDWEKTDLWRSAIEIPGVEVVMDDGKEARRFNAVTSGQTVVYDAQGHLRFSGGITGSRGHSGDNAGRSAIVSLVNGADENRSESAVFGCPLFGPHSACKESEDD